jgi:tol-pal system protein YbgF
MRRDVAKLSPLSLAIWTLAAAAILTGCSAPLVGPSEPAIADLAEMKERILELQRKATIAEVELERLRRQVAALEASLEEQGERSAPSSDLADRLRAVPVPPAAPSARSEPAAAPVVEVTDLRPVVVAPPPIEPAAVEEPAALASDPAAVQAGPVAPAAQTLYDRGYTLFHQGQYLDAETTFQRFLQSYSATELGDNAQYWIGESRYARGDLNGALSAFRATAERFPDGNKVPDALLKSADCLAGLGDVEGARAVYSEVIRRFPGAVAAAVAEERRAALP